VLLLREGVAGLHGAAVEAFVEPTHALLGASVGKRFGLNTAAGHLLNTIIANRRGCA
jgi:hypothetical protein